MMETFGLMILSHFPLKQSSSVNALSWAASVLAGIARP